MDAWMIGLLAAPVGALVFGGIALSAKWLIATYMPDGWLQDQLLRERWKSKCSRSNRRVLEQAARCSRERTNRIVVE